MHNLIIPNHLHLFRLDKAISELMQDQSRSQLQKSIKSGLVKVNEKIIYDSSFKIKENDLLEIELYQNDDYEMQKSDIDIDVIYEDDDIIVVNKPPNLTVHPGAGNKHNTLANALLGHYSSLSDLGGQSRPGIVHRLDKDTSGLMVVAKNNQAHLNLAKQLEARTLKRKYKALIWGLLKPGSGIIQNNIGRSRINRKKIAVLKFGGKIAITHYETKELFSNGAISLVECILETGRTHQIRVHLSHLGHSIIGDQTYGNNSRKISNLDNNLPLKEELQNFKRQALHSYYISFTHPISNKILEIEIDFPDDIKKIIKLFKISTIELGGLL